MTRKFKPEEMEGMEEMEGTEMMSEELVGTMEAEVAEEIATAEPVEKAVYHLDDGTECSRSAYIRQEFNKGKSRQDIAKALDVKYYVVYSATANMFNEAHPADGAGTGRGSVMVAKVNTEFQFVDADGMVVTVEEEAAQVPRADMMRELAEAGVERSAIKEHFGVAYATVYAATKDSSETAGTRVRKMVTDPETGEEMKRADYIRKLYAAGMERREIAKQLTMMTGDLVDYSTVWAATKADKEATAETEAIAIPEDAEEEVAAE